MTAEDEKQEPVASAGEKEEPRSIKDMTIGQLFEIIDYIKKFWILLLALGSAVYLATTHFATSEAVEKLACQAERRVYEERHRSAVTLLERQREDLSNQQTSLLKLQSILLDVQVSNPEASLDLTSLKSQMKDLINSAELSKRDKAEEIEQAKKDLDVAEDTVKSCTKEK